ncbi:bacteriohemerythrin [Pelagibaculum spongiae]|uniref:Bacteriohemerythrin n=1 Tax=Pelagibaculum spongiae TaxID=2080658 RepID=A0A2V1H1P1_9GAMM|nr:bacteriohemerythrin [Pelagibaculum spongiae]PVZ68796.1 bacteriohemerythrin [Pelagibaculum spongiae]
MPIKWTEDWEIGIQVIDNQHKRIVDYINELEVCQTADDKAGVSKILTELTDYTSSHFAFEENLMEEAGYGFVTAHQKVHHLFIRRVEEYKTRYLTGEDIASELTKTLETWLFNHIKHDDKDYSGIVKQNLELATAKVKKQKSKSWFGRLFGKAA